MLTQLKARRLQENITQAQAAERLGIGLSAYSLIESGRMRPSRAQMRALEETFGHGAHTLLDPLKDALEQVQ
jgi:transcriptional regulator with XRE-family HTH domain